MLAAAARTASPAALARSARCFATDWSAVTAKTTSDITKGEVNRLRQTHGEGAALAAKFASPPAPIDWAAYKGKIRSAGVVESFEKSYAAIKWPTESDIGAFKDGNDAAIETAAADWQATAASAAAMAEESLARIAELEELVALMESKKVGVNTTTEDIFEAYPEIEADIIEDLNAHKWSKDV